MKSEEIIQYIDEAIHLLEWNKTVVGPNLDKIDAQLTKLESSPEIQNLAATLLKINPTQLKSLLEHARKLLTSEQKFLNGGTEKLITVLTNIKSHTMILGFLAKWVL